MKTIQKKWQILSVCAVLFILLGSWRFTESHVNPTFSKFLESQTVSGAAMKANQAVVDRFFTKLAKKKAAGFTNFTVYYNMQELGTPYLDGNLLVELDNVQQIFEFWSVSSSFSSTISGYSATMRVACPIFLEWQTVGCYRLQVKRWDSELGIWAMQFDQTKVYQTWETPDIGAFDEYFTVYPGETYSVSIVCSYSCKQLEP